MRWGPVSCFAEDDLYTTKWGDFANRDIEKFFFGKIDGEGKSAVEHFSDFTFGEGSYEAFDGLLPYMSAQKLRTPKGLGFLNQLAGLSDPNHTLMLLQRMQNMFCAIWAECVWQIADASNSATKFIISDQPVVVYNRERFPGSRHCAGFNDADIREVATHTYFPLSLNKILILTNLTWVRDPYQNPHNIRQNPRFFRDTTFNFLDIQGDRFLTEEEVLEINYITKSRALRYVAAAEKEWLYPEKKLRSTHWRKLGNGQLLMPEPRHIHGGGETLIGYGDGSSDAFDTYGHRPGQRGYRDANRDAREMDTLERFKAEWSAMHGPNYRGLTHSYTFEGSAARTSVTDEFHSVLVAIDREFSKQKGERSRRRRLLRSPAK